LRDKHWKHIKNKKKRRRRRRRKTSLANHKSNCSSH